MPYVKSEYDYLDKYQSVYGDEFYYYVKGTNILHNPYGPAVINTNGYKEYWIEGKLHRLDGPARIFVDDEDEYWINYEELTKEEFEKHPERLKFLGKEYLILLK